MISPFKNTGLGGFPPPPDNESRPGSFGKIEEVQNGIGYKMKTIAPRENRVNILLYSLAILIYIAVQ